MLSQHIDPAHIQAVHAYLKQEFPSLTIETFPEKDAQTYSLKLDTAELHRVSVTYACFQATEDMVTKLPTMRLVDELRKREREPLRVTTAGLSEGVCAE